ncbi:Sec-independent protein translocase protein TatAy [Anaerolineae bacterium]|nr:Sec-independent protein translocase protein TatAy [Anaerolineae bacterium]
MFRPEPLDIIIIVLIALLVFGANRLPETARAIGQAMREFRNAVTGKDVESKTNDAHDPAADAPRRNN